MEPTIWYTSNPNSIVVCSALHHGTGFRLRHADEACDMPGKNPGPSIVYGLLRGCSEIIQRCVAAGNDYWHIDRGYFGGGHFDGYYRISHNGLQATRPVTLPDLDDRYGVPLKAWRRPGDVCIISPPTLPVVAHYRMTDWLAPALRQAEMSGYRPVVSSKDNPWRNYADEAGVLMTFNSNAAVEALVDGIAVISTGPTALKDYCGDRLTTLMRPSDRRKVIAWLTHCQFTLAEFRAGTAWRKVMEIQP